MLEVKQLNAFYGKSHILQGLNISIKEGEIISLLGRNGVGRSTTIKTNPRINLLLNQPKTSPNFIQNL